MDFGLSNASRVWAWSLSFVRVQGKARAVGIESEGVSGFQGSWAEPVVLAFFSEVRVPHPYPEALRSTPTPPSPDGGFQALGQQLSKASAPSYGSCEKGPSRSAPPLRGASRRENVTGWTILKRV